METGLPRCGDSPVTWARYGALGSCRFRHICFPRLLELPGRPLHQRRQLRCRYRLKVLARLALDRSPYLLLVEPLHRPQVDQRRPKRRSKGVGCAFLLRRLPGGRLVSVEAIPELVSEAAQGAFETVGNRPFAGCVVTLRRLLRPGVEPDVRAGRSAGEVTRTGAL